ncbi:lipocalin family protein [Chryseobacterium sp. c4a]|uniref:lipocalin family protein n=1 Tax=Chryseobacterium sp. c4a TaxID=1573582 RepID=UPI00135B1EA8|nr:lipocalin family protein [Chryseobacterium sp. c4a]
MKKLFLALAAFSAIVSCSSDDNNSKKEEVSPIVGTWNQYKADVYTTSDNKTKAVYPSGCESENTFEYNKTEVNTVGHSLNKDGACVPSDYHNAKYTYDQNAKKLWYNNSNRVYKVNKLTSTELVTEDNTEDRDGDGMNDVVIRYFRRVK